MHITIDCEVDRCKRNITITSPDATMVVRGLHKVLHKHGWTTEIHKEKEVFYCPRHSLPGKSPITPELVEKFRAVFGES